MPCSRCTTCHSNAKCGSGIRGTICGVEKAGARSGIARHQIYLRPPGCFNMATGALLLDAGPRTDTGHFQCGSPGERRISAQRCGFSGSLPRKVERIGPRDVGPLDVVDPDSHLCALASSVLLPPTPPSQRSPAMPPRAQTAHPAHTIRGQGRSRSRRSTRTIRGRTDLRSP